MLKNLYIQNFILIDELSLDFHDGFSAFTGETGAGKSILLDAISVLSMERSSASLIMKDKDKAIIEGTFSLHDDIHAKKILEEAGFEVEEDTIITREIYKNGKSQSRINHRIVTFSLLQNCLRDQIDIHGQRDNAYLLDSNNHMHLLDAYCGHTVLLNEVKDKYYIYADLVKQKEKALQENYNESELEIYTYQVNEIDEAQLQIGEDNELEEQEKAYKVIKNAFEKLNLIVESYKEGLSNDLYQLNYQIQSLEDNDTFITAKKQMNDGYYNIEEAIDSLTKILNQYDYDEDSINAMQERLFFIQRMKRKYGRTIEDILKTRDDLNTKIEMMDNRQAYLEEMDQKIEKAKNAYETVAQKLHASRLKHAPKLDAEIQIHLKDLGLTHAQFQTQITDAKESAFGNDAIAFYVSMNKGEQLRPLIKTASGGEISRLMLGLKVIFTNLQGIKTIIFDEIDTGVSGNIATSIGQKMKALAKDVQVFSVTHLAQVASCADYHYHVEKAIKGKRTITSVKELNKEESIEELAYISTGEVTSSSLSAAEELYRRNHS
ncbi:MAG: DNA repair protein RecN [Solobacterium sp.]|nr:DNA repair protein RecN [Solobacterium sp.]